jgi:hypothetical protein
MKLSQEVDFSFYHSGSNSGSGIAGSGLSNSCGTRQKCPLNNEQTPKQ